jgi:hypothetical protein
MSPDAVSPTPSSRDVRPWRTPTIVELPKLTKLTLASAIGGGGGTGGGGSTVFGIVLAIGLLAGCSANEATAPSDQLDPRNMAVVSCRASVVAGSVDCRGPSTAPGQEQLGGQGIYVALTSSNVEYDETTDDFTFGVAVQNLTAQAIGTTGGTPTGVRVFFVSPPTATLGNGAITVEDDSVGTVTAPGQSYYLYPDSLFHLATSDTLPWRFSVPGTVDEFAFTVLVAADVRDQGGVLRWQQLDGYGSFVFTSVASAALDDAMVIASGGALFHWDGTSWKGVVRPSNALGSIVAERGGSYVATDAVGGLWRYKNGVWRPFRLRGQGAVRFVDLDQWVTSRSELGNPFFYYSVAGVIDSVPGGHPSGVWYAQTPNGSIRSFFYSQYVQAETSTNGAPWVTRLAFANGMDGLNDIGTGVMYNDAGEEFFAYTTPIAPHTVGLIRRNGTDTIFKSTTEVPTRLYNPGGDSLFAAVVGAGGTRIVKVKYGSFPVVNTTTVTSTFPSTFFQAPVGPMLVPRDEGMTDWFALDEAGQLWMSEGGVFSQVVIGDPGFIDSWAAGDTTWHASGNTTLSRLVGTTVTTFTAPSNVNAIWGASTTEIYLAGADSIWKWDGGATFELEQVYADPGGGINKLWGDAGTGTLIATTYGGSVLHRVGGAWTILPAAVPDPLAVWGCSGTVAWITNYHGDVYRWESGVVSEDAAFGGTFTPPGGLTFTGGNSCADVWVGGDGAVLYHWNGTSWADFAASTGGATFSAIAPRGNGEAYLGGLDGSFALIDVLGNADRTTLPAGDGAINTIARRANGELVVGSARTVLIGKR